MDLSDFIATYERTGKTILEAKDKPNIDDYLCMFAGLQNPPTEVADNGEDIIKQFTMQPGEQVVSKTLTGKGKEGQKSFYYMGTGCRPQGKGGPPFVTFTDKDWTALLSKFEEGKQLDPQAEPGNTPQETKTMEQLNQEQQAANMAQADAFGDATTQMLAEAGFPGGGNGLQMRDMFRQVCGGGRANALQKAAREKSEAKNNPEALSAEAQQEQNTLQNEGCYQDLLIINTAISRSTEIYKKIQTGGDNLTESDRDFLRQCFRLRGRGQNQGVYMVPDDLSGDYCGGPLAAAAIPYQQGGDRYGVKVGNQNSPFFKMMLKIHEDSLKKGNPLYDEGKPAIFRGGTDAAKMHSFRAMEGVMNEHGPNIAKAWIECGRKMPCSGIKGVLEQVMDEENFQLNLLIFGAEQRNAGVIPDTQFGNIYDDGTELMLDDVEASAGDPDGKKALAWFAGNMINAWDPLLSDPAFKDCEFEVVGRGPTGQMENGGSVNQDVQVTCGSIVRKLEVNPNYQGDDGAGIFGSDEDRNRGHWTGEPVAGLNVKISSRGDMVQAGKRGIAVIDAVETDPEGQITGFSPSTESARNRASNLIYSVAEKNGASFTEEDKKAADDYKLKEVGFTQNIQGSLDSLSRGTVKTVVGGIMSKMGYEQGEKFAELDKTMEQYQNATPGTPDYKKAAARIKTVLRQAYRNKHKDSAGFRQNLAIEALQTGVASQNQGFVLVEPGEDTYVGTETDAHAGIFKNILGYGNDEGPQEIRVTGTSVVLATGEQLTCRVKEGTPVQEYRAPTESVKSNLRALSGAKAGRGKDPVTESRREAEDIVRQFQELIQRVNKVNSVQN